MTKVQSMLGACTLRRENNCRHSDVNQASLNRKASAQQQLDHDDHQSVDVVNRLNRIMRVVIDPNVQKLRRQREVFQRGINGLK